MESKNMDLVFNELSVSTGFTAKNAAQAKEGLDKLMGIFLEYHKRTQGQPGIFFHQSPSSLSFSEDGYSLSAWLSSLTNDKKDKKA